MSPSSRPDEGPDLGPYRLQKLVLKATPDTEGLAWRTSWQEPALSRGAPSIPAGEVLRFDTYLNSFYESHWRGLAGLKSLILETTTSGSCRIRLIRRAPGQADQLLADMIVRGGDVRSRLSVSLEDLSATAAVIHFELEALEGTVEVHDGAWLSHDPRRNPVRLAIVICSFQREEMLIDALRTLGPAVSHNADIKELIVVRQGGRALSGYPPYAALAAAELFGGKLRMIEQANFGGSGGFARGMIEGLEANATDILLLDDDIRIEPSLLERLTALLARVGEPTTIGGQMLELERPSSLHASAEETDFPALKLHNRRRGTDLTSTGIAALFGGVERGDYHAWWFCCVPASVIRDQGLPMPMFVRHDDVEYGVRTRAAGFPGVVMPGLFVWHEAFAGKMTPLYIYYDRRNLLICACLHTSPRPLRWALQHARETSTALRKRRYEYCWALCRAVDDFLKGPGTVFSGLVERHGRLKAEHARLALLTMADHRSRAAERASGRTKARLHRTFRQLALMSLRTSLALLWRTAVTARAYRSTRQAYSSEAYWRDLLGIAQPAKGRE